MFAVIFEVTFNDNAQASYQTLASQLSTELEKADGFISNERFQSLTTPGKLLSLSYWLDEEALQNWRNQMEHRQAQSQGRNGIFKDYHIHVAQVVRHYSLHDRQQTPTDSRQHHPEV